MEKSRRMGRRRRKRGWDQGEELLTSTTTGLKIHTHEYISEEEQRTPRAPKEHVTFEIKIIPNKPTGIRLPLPNANLQVVSM